MKKIIVLFILVTSAAVHAQHKKADTLRAVLSKATTDTGKLQALKELSYFYFQYSPDSSILYAQPAYEIAVKHKWILQQVSTMTILASAYEAIGEYSKAVPFYMKSVKFLEATNNTYAIIAEYDNIGYTYVMSGDYSNALIYLRVAKNKYDSYFLTHKISSDTLHTKCHILSNLGECFLYVKKIDSAFYYLNKSYQDAQKNHYDEIINNIERDLGEVEAAKGHKATALKHYKKSVSLSISNDDIEAVSVAYLSTSRLYHQYKQQDSAEYFALKALESAKSGNYQHDVLNASKALYTYYDEDHNLTSAYKYFKLATVAKDSIYSHDKLRRLLSVDFEEKERQRDIADAQIKYSNKIRTYVFISGLVVLLSLSFIFWRISKQRTKANLLLQQQKKDIESTLVKLQHTQGQLIQSEKMASLGELTAGIAHEIQNPLNFVNNFSDVNQEMIGELEEELNKGDVEEARAIAADIRENEKKINHHGKRADAIVKGMLEHSRAGTGEKQSTNLNALADEFLRLSYHGLRSKDKLFNAELVTHFDPDLPKANVVQQDMGRVLLNLFNNAFYAVNQKQKTAGADYKPEVSVSTSAEKNNLIIKVKDNGIGIPDNIKEKILQPFFTTKPTGEGTGLGLSLSYDIIVKVHGGKINIESKEGEGAEFIIDLPIA